ncbi:hypothetical protein BV22DRAFT_1134025 [Leucogyrophana mollusca]|uniref:Uncharacterized protein n=1 Tax=Leucogyrophana mollusca TaxID=85980 RepID=A0ACB8B234_9AGAM|nr:hypothetical protein BV22DRAFT_1134025 [Leucogyrophana mollusca]
MTTLEGDIAERDHPVSAFTPSSAPPGPSPKRHPPRGDRILKCCLLQGRSVVLPDPTPLPDVSAAISSTTSPIPPRVSGYALRFGGASARASPVHTTLVPPLAVLSAVLAVKASVLGGGGVSLSVLGTNSMLENQGEREKQGLQENIKPGLINSPSPPGTALDGFNINGTQSFNNAAGDFDSFTEINPFALKTLDVYRMQLLGRMAE